MSTVQKAFTFIVLILAILVASVSWVLFAQRTNWRAQSDQKQQQLTQTQGQLADLKKETDTVISADKAKMKDLEVQTAGLQSDLRDTQAALENTRNDKAMQEALTTELKDKVAILAASMEQYTTRMAELQIAKEAAERMLEDVKASAQDAQEQLVIAERKNRDLDSKITTLTEQVAARDEQIKGLEQRVNVLQVYAGPVGQTPVPVNMQTAVYGKVVGVANNGDTIFVSLGTDDGVKDGMALLVYKNDGTYIATAQINNVSADKSAARVLSPVLGTITEGDNVTNK